VNKLVGDELHMLSVDTRPNDWCLQDIRQLLESNWKVQLRASFQLRVAFAFRFVHLLIQAICDVLC
jgi:hypothetical protein